MLTSRLTRSLRGSLHNPKLLSPSTDNSGSTAGVVDPLFNAEESWTHITDDDLPIQLDDPPIFTPTTSSHTLAPRTQGPNASSRFSFTRLKNISRISVSARRANSVRFGSSSHRPALPFLGNRSDRSESAHSILDEFPQPPSHLPTPITPTEYNWPQSSRSFVESGRTDHEVERAEAVSTLSRQQSNPFKSLSRAFSRLGRKKSTKTELTVIPENTTVRPPCPIRPPPSPPAEEPEPCRVYHRVNPTQLTASPSFLEAESLAISARSSFVPPSPSWLSRNVAQRSDSRDKDLPAPPTDTAEEIPTPSSPSPLPIPPRILITSADSDDLLSPLEATEGFFLEYPEVQIRRLDTTHEALLLKPPTPFLGIPTPSAIPHSPSPSYLEFISRFSFQQLESERGSELYDSPDSKPTLVSDSPPQRDIFLPTLSPNEPDLPRDFSNLLSTLFIEAGLSIATTSTMNFGKRNDVVDFGGEVDYDIEWFKEAPPAHLRPQPPPAEPVGSPYVPDGAVIEQNESFEFALGAAPNVLYARYKQYGQLGVLAWCAEFGELIDNLKELGFAGNMFVSTRTQALKACEDILKLRLDIGMQIIMLYLSSQVARLRRFLDGDRIWDDYPEPSFPLDPNSYSK